MGTPPSVSVWRMSTVITTWSLVAAPSSSVTVSVTVCVPAANVLAGFADDAVKLDAAKR